jgi:rod shape-determining protein MreD
VKAFWTALALLVAFLVQSALTHLVPRQARMVDLFMLVLVYCGLVGGETHAMLAGLAGGWVQDIQFGGAVVGLSGLTKVLVGFGVGLSGTRFHLTEPGARVMVLFAATLLDAVIFERLASAFDIRIDTLSLGGALTRAALNAALGGVVFFYLDRYLARRRRA